MPNILKLASHHLIVYPFPRLDIRRLPPALHALTLSQFPHGYYFGMHHPHSVSIWLEAAYDPSITNQTRLDLWVIERNSGRLRFTHCSRFCNCQSTQKPQGSTAIGPFAINNSIKTTYFRSISTNIDFHSDLFWEQSVGSSSLSAPTNYSHSRSEFRDYPRWDC